MIPASPKAATSMQADVAFGQGAAADRNSGERHAANGAPPLILLDNLG
ncbi:MAG TPA: hypothetical protein VF913_12825 [Xanthobacteraceae bacterium]